MCTDNLPRGEFLASENSTRRNYLWWVEETGDSHLLMISYVEADGTVMEFGASIDISLNDGEQVKAIALSRCREADKPGTHAE